MQMLLMNPRKRRRKAAARRRHGRRRMTAKQLKYFGPRKRRASSRRRSRIRSAGRSIVVQSNPSPRRRRRARRAASRSVRRFRRNPINVGAIRASASSVIGVAGRAVNGALGAVAADVAMAQASRFLPVSVSSRYNADGSMNPVYYGGKAALTIVLGILGTRFAPGRLKSYVARGVEGALTVQGYEVVRSLLPASLTMGYYNPGRVAGGGAGMNRIGRMGRVGAYLPANVGRGMNRIGALRASYGGGTAFTGAGLSDARIGEGPQQ